MFTRDHIISEIKRTAQGNKGIPLGKRRFYRETGIKESDCLGKFWARWSDAIVEAGFRPNKLQGPRNAEELLVSLASFARELGHFPTNNEIKLRARREKGFPWDNTFARFGNRQALAVRLRDFCLAHKQEDVAALCAKMIPQPDESRSSATDDTAGEYKSELGYVYLLKSGRYYKIGRTNAVGRRERELAVQLPEEAKVVHSIKTDDPVGIEAYWHNRFSDRRKNGEWFELTGKHVTVFKRRKFM